MGTKVSCDVFQTEDGVGITRKVSHDKSSVPIPTHCGRFIKHSAKQIQSRMCVRVMSVKQDVKLNWMQYIYQI